MPTALLSVAIRSEHNTVAARQRSRQIARALGFDPQDQTRIATAVSEIARNAIRYAGGGKVEFLVEGASAPQLLIVKVTDKGPGIRDLDRILEGRYASKTGMGMGIIGARRLMDQFEIDSEPGRGTTVVLKKVFPRNGRYVAPEDFGPILDQLAKDKPSDPLSELQLQNQELLRALEELRRRQDELRRVNRELEDTNRGVVALYAELDEKADHLRRADELKSKFLSNMSHEFRSPLNSILALTRLLAEGADGPLNAEQLQQVGYVRKAAEDLYELVNDLLDLAKVEAGKVEVKPSRFTVTDLFGALRGMLRPLFLNQSVALIFEPADDLPGIYADEAKVSQILRNFISNALKFTEKGEVRVSAEMNGSDRVCFSVADTGIGVAPQDHERIFEDFAQVDHPIQKRVRGTGLGLPLSKKLAQLLDGEIRLTSELGKGSTFTLDLPVYWRKGSEALAPPVEESEGAIPVLALEDSAEMTLVYSRWLRGSEFQLQTARSTWEAEQKIAAEKPAALILDLLLDGEDSWTLLAWLKASESTRELPVLVVSTTDDRSKAFHLGADAYLVKPVTREMLLDELRLLTARSARARRVLIIDDDEKDRYLLKRALRDSGMEVHEASTGRDGIAKAIAVQPDIILLDVGLPDMDGFQVLRALHSDERTRRVPVVINTSMALTPKQREELQARALAVLSKEQSARDRGFDELRRLIAESAAYNVEHLVP